MKYAIVSTWNGEGYSSSNTAEVKEFNNDNDALTFIRNLAKEYEEDFEIEVYQKEGMGKINFDNLVDQGSFQFHRLNEDDFGVVIQCNINEADIESKIGFNAMLDLAIKQADQDELDELDLSSNNIFIGAYEGDYDYQFIKF